MNRSKRAIPTLLLLGLLPLTQATAAGTEGEGRSFVTEAGRTVEIDRDLVTGPAGGRALRRDVTVLDEAGNVIGERRDLRGRTADGDRVRAAGRRWTDAHGDQRTATRARRADADGDVHRRTARTVRDEDGALHHRSVNRTHRQADGDRRSVQRRLHAGEHGNRATRRVLRDTGDGTRAVHRQRFLRLH